MKSIRIFIFGQLDFQQIEEKGKIEDNYTPHQPPFNRAAMATDSLQVPEQAIPLTMNPMNAIRQRHLTLANCLKMGPSSSIPCLFGIYYRECNSSNTDG